MCKVGKRCASHLKKQIEDIQNQDEPATKDLLLLPSLRMEYYGTPTGQKQLTKAIAETQDEEHTQKLKALKAKAKEMRENPPLLSRGEKINRHIEQVAKEKAKIQKQYEADESPVVATHSAMNGEEVKRYNQAFHELNEKLTEDEKSSMSYYTGIGFDPMNLYLRDPVEYKKRFKDEKSYEEAKSILVHKYQNIDSFLSKAPDDQKTVYRVLHQETGDIDKPVNLMPSSQYAENLGFIPGRTINFPAYVSTTADPSHVSRRGKHEMSMDVALVINTKKGAPVDFTSEETSGVSFTQDREREVLLPRDMSFTVDRTEKNVFIDDEGSSCALTTVYLNESE